MKTNIPLRFCLFVLGLSPLAAPSAYAQTRPITLLEVHSSDKGARFFWQIDRSAFNDLPKWDGEGNPPLSVADAVRIARRALKLGDDSGPHKLFSISLQRPARIDSQISIPGPVFYLVTFRSENPAHLQEPYDVVVLLDGNVVSPATEPIKK